jgi:hypothetical protein
MNIIEVQSGIKGIKNQTDEQNKQSFNSPHTTLGEQLDEYMRLGVTFDDIYFEKVFFIIGEDFEYDISQAEKLPNLHYPQKDKIAVVLFFGEDRLMSLDVDAYMIDRGKPTCKLCVNLDDVS